MKNNVTVVSSWLKDLSEVVGMKLALNTEGICTFQVGEDVIAIEVARDRAQVYIYSVLVTLPKEGTETAWALLTRALELNAFQILTRGGAIAAPPGGGCLIYCCTVPIEGCDSVKFSGMLGTFFETLPELRKMLSEVLV